MKESNTKKKLTAFLTITFTLSAVFYYQIISAGTLESGGGLYVLLLMWTPGIAGIVTQLFFERSLKGMGWRPGKIKYLGVAYILPLLYCLVVYGLTWITGLGGVPATSFINSLSSGNPGTSIIISILIYTIGMGTVGVLISLLSALGEEIGWRGLLVPELSKIMPFTMVSLISGLIWALWHMPLILFADYNLPGIPKWYAALMFLIMVIGISFVFAWLRVKSGSLWTAAILHASHNIFVQAIFTPLTEKVEITPYIIDEFGCGLAIIGIILAFYFWGKQKELTLPDQNLI